MTSKAAAKKFTHSYGIAFDIAYVKSKECATNLFALEEVLNEMRKEDRILLYPERGFICVTVL